MKASSIFAASLLVAGAAFAGTTEVTNDLVIGVMPVPLEAGKKDAILSIPWIEAGTNTAVTAGVAVTNLVKTAGLSEGDTLTWYNPNDTEAPYQQWKVVTGSDGTNYWNAGEKMLTLTGDRTALAAGSADLKRGQALVLTRNSNYANATNVYVVGQYTTTAPVTTTFAHATVDSSTGKKRYTYTLAAPPQVKKIGGYNGYIELNSNTWTNVQNDDKLIVGFGTVSRIQFVRGLNNTCWGTNKYEKLEGALNIYRKVFDPNALLPIGRGFWYESTGTENDVEVNWALPSAE